MTKKLQGKILSIILLVFIAQICSGSTLLPKIPGWTLIQIGSRDLLSAKGLQGNIEEYTYKREVDNKPVKALILSGTAFGTQKNRPAELRGEDDPMGEGESYRVITMNHMPVVIEMVPHIGVALSIALSGDLTIVLEAPENMASEVETIALAIAQER